MHHRLSLALGLALGTVLAPPTARAEMGVDAPTSPPRPPSEEVASLPPPRPQWTATRAPRERRLADSERTNWPIVAPGIAMFGAAWILNAVASLPAGECGPVIPTGSSARCVPDEGWDAFRWTGLVPVIGPFIQLALKPGSLGDDTWAAWLGVNGLVQITGLVLLVAGLLAPERHDAGTVLVIPQASTTYAGLAVLGRF